MSSAGVSPLANPWLTEHGPGELEKLFRSIIFHPSAAIVITDDDARYQEASVGAARLLGRPRNSLPGQKLHDFAPHALQPQVAQLWESFLATGEKEGTLQLLGPDGSPREVQFTAKGNILPVRHVLALRDKTPSAQPDRIPSWVQDYALFLLDQSSVIVAWYGGAERLYGYSPEQVISHHVSMLNQQEAGLADRLDRDFDRAASSGHIGTEGFHCRADSTLFWANTITMALKDQSGVLRGFACVVRDFSERHDLDEKLRRKRARGIVQVPNASIAGIISGEFDQIPDVNDAFLDIIGYTREDVESGHITWADLSPVEYAPLDELAHEEGLRFGACTPYEKELVRKDGVRVPILIATAVVKLCPFRWISFVQDLSVRHRQESVEDPAAVTGDFDEIVGNSVGLRLVQQQVEVVAPTDATVLILGETGTGKELIARAIHRLSPRRNLPFITLNCAAIPTGLLESELFGYERGAFTGALTQKIGRFEMAHRGTLFLDEVGDIPLDLQPKLLRALQEKSFERLGGIRTIPIDVRLVAATNRNLTEMMGDKLFRSDLYYRLKVFPITSPPLRDRPDDIPILARHFTRKYAEKMGRTIDKIPTETLRALVDWHWPGNVRELENFIERSVILSVGPNLRAPISEIRDAAPETQGGSTLEQVEREHILRVLRESTGVVTAAATRLGLHRTTLNAMMRKLGISRKDF